MGIIIVSYNLLITRVPCLENGRGYMSRENTPLEKLEGRETNLQSDKVSATRAVAAEPSAMCLDIYDPA